MLDFLPNKKMTSLILSLILILSVITMPVFADDAVITEHNTYVLNRDGNGEPLYRYQSPCMIGYDFNNQYGGNGVPIQAFVYTMYNAVTQKHFPTYCGDINITAVQGTDYRRLNLEDSSFSGNAAGKVRAILTEGFYIIPIDGESDADHAARVNAKTAELAKASGAEDLTTGEAIAATQAAIWRIVHGPELSFPKFCRYVFNPTNTKYGSLCSYSELRYKNNTLINTTIETAYNYLISLDPVAATERTVSAASFTDLNDPVFTQNADGSYDVSITVTVDVDMDADDTLTLKAELTDSYISKTSLASGSQVVTLTLKNVPASLISDDVTLSISGYQTSAGYFLFDAEGARGASQTMVGYDNSRLPVYAEVLAKEDRVLNIQKLTKVAVGNDSYENKPLSNIAFDIFPVATREEYLSGAVTLPNASEYVHPALADYTLITDENGEASLNFLHFGLPDGIYLVAEHPHPSIVSPIEPFYLHVPSTDPLSGEPIYDITIKPKNNVKGSVHIEKDVIAIGNDESSVNAYEAHTWIIGSTIPEDIATGQHYMISDTLDNRLDYLGNVAVVLEKNGEESDILLTVGTDYKLTVTDADSLSEGKPSDSFTIELTTGGMNRIAGIIGDNNFNSYMLRVYFDAQINANAEMGTQIPNRADLEYVNSVNFEFYEESDIPVVYTGGLNLLKVDARDSSVTLSGAAFELYRAATPDEIASNDPRLIEIADVVGKVIKVSFFNNREMQGDKVTTATSGEDGKVSFYGLSYGKYFLTETTAPSGYNLLGKTIELTVNESSHNDDKVIIIENTTGNVLPSTGGVGTTVFIVTGISVMSIAAIFLCIDKRRRQHHKHCH